MSNLAHKLPTLAEELDSKTFDTLNWLVTSVRNGHITEDQFSVGVDALFMAVSGLVSEGFISLFAATNDLVIAKSAVKRIFFKVEDGEMRHVRFAWLPGEDVLAATRFTGGEAYKGNVMKFADAEEAQWKLKTLHISLEKMGWVEL